MNAQEMFKELGYDYDFICSFGVVTERYTKMTDDGMIWIFFNRVTDCIEVEFPLNCVQTEDITNAITKRQIELGWIK